MGREHVQCGKGGWEGVPGTPALPVSALLLLCLVVQSCPTLCDTMDCSPPGSSVHGDSPGKNTGVGCHDLLQGIFLTQGLNASLPHCRQILYHLSHQGSPRILEWVAYPFSRGSSQSRNQTRVSCFAGRFFTSWATGEALSPSMLPVGNWPVAISPEIPTQRGLLHVYEGHQLHSDHPWASRLLLNISWLARLFKILFNYR